jgi:hypothetical protein
MQRLTQLFEESKNQWGLSQRTVQSIFWLPIISTVLILLLRLYKPAFRFLLEEDGVFEWVSFVFFALTGIFSLMLASRLRKLKHPWQALLFLLFGLAMLFAAGEEITWGQRIFNWETPEAVQEINNQDETNLHNIEGVLDTLNLIMLAMGLYGVFASFVSRRLKPERWWFKANYLYVPPDFLISAFIFITLFRLFRLFVVPDGNFTVNRMAEWFEFLLSYGLAVFTWLNLWHLRKNDSENNL